MRRVQSSDRVSDRGARTKFVLRLRSNYQILKHKQITECLRNVATFTHIIPQSKSNPAVVYMATRADMKKAYETFKKQYSDKIEVEAENPKYIQEISEPRREARSRSPSPVPRVKASEQERFLESARAELHESTRGLTQSRKFNLDEPMEIIKQIAKAMKWKPPETKVIGDYPKWKFSILLNGTEYVPNFFCATRRSAENAVANLCLVDLDMLTLDQIWRDIDDYILKPEK